MQGCYSQWLTGLLVMLFCNGVGGNRVCAESIDANSISLAGTWQFAMDRDDKGLDEQWYARTLQGRIALPGILQSQEYGDPISIDTPWVLSLYDRYWYLRKEFKQFAQPGDVKVPFLSQPQRHYLGTAWYQRTIEIPDNWAGRRIVLLLERARWKSTVWIDDGLIGSQDSLVTPHQFDLGAVNPGTHTLTIRVDNRMQMDYRPDGHSVSDSLGSTWNGIVGRIELFSTTPVWIDQVRAFSDIETKSVSLKVGIGNITHQSGEGILTVNNVKTPVSWTAEGGKAEIVFNLGDDAKLWSEFDPHLYHFNVHLGGEQADDMKTVTVGLRKISTDGNVLLVNGRPSHFRGTHSGGDFPLTGYPATDVDYWRKLFKTCQAWGLNHVRFHSFCPPEAAFVAADELGMYLQPEAGMWNTINPGTEMEKRLYEESDRMLRAYGNHPSFVLFSPSNEPKGHWKESLTKWVEYYREKDSRRLYTTGTGWPLIEKPGHVEGADFLAVHRIGPRPVRGDRAWFGRDYLGSMRGVDVPILVHELGQWCAFPDFDVIDKFAGYMQPGNYQIFKTLMKNAGLLDKDKIFAQASGKFQVECYKEEIEANLRTPGLAGFQLLDLHDYVGQGTALVGVLDPFWEEKGYISPEQWRRFCNTTVPLAVLKKRIFTIDDPFEIGVLISHYGQSDLTDTAVVWRIENADQQVVATGQWPVERISQGSAIELGQLKADLSKFSAPGAYKLIVVLSGTEFENDWDFWLYPTTISEKVPDDVLVTRSFDAAVKELEKGRKVLFVPRQNELAWQSPPIGRRPIFWNRLMGPNWERFLGIVCDLKHPALAKFPTDFYYDWQWEGVFRPYCRAINMDSLPAELEPVVQVIDDWNRDYKLGAVFECQVGKGKLVVCAADLESDLKGRPVAAQLRRSLLDYMCTEAFSPVVSATPEQFLGLRFDNQIMYKLGAVALADPNDGPDSVDHAIDGNPNTYWTTAKRRGGSRYPHEMVIKFPKLVEMTGLVVMNRQDQRQHEGDICDYMIQTSEDGKQWQTVKKGQLESTFDPQRIKFDEKITTAYLKLRALSGFGDDISASLAEIAVIYTGPRLTDESISAAAAYRKTASATEEMYETDNPLENSTNPTAAKVYRITADSESMTDRVEYALDDDPETFWHTEWRGTAPKHPHWLMLEFKQPLILTGLQYLPRQDRSNGWIKEYAIEISSDGKQWRQIAAGAFQASKDLQTVTFTEPVKTTFLRLEALSEMSDQAFTSVAELRILESNKGG